MNSSETLSRRSAIDFDGMIQKVLARWGQLSPYEKNDRSFIERIIDQDFHGFFLSPEDRDILEERINGALAEKGYTGQPLEALNETRRLITRCVLEEFI